MNTGDDRVFEKCLLVKQQSRYCMDSEVTCEKRESTASVCGKQKIRGRQAAKAENQQEMKTFHRREGAEISNHRNLL
jgi:hypothetical protein